MIDAVLDNLEEKNIDAELKALRKISKASGITSEITTRLKASILSVDGNDERAFNESIEKWGITVETAELREKMSTKLN